MIKVLILYYLSLKSTHGYEIQKFIQANHMDSWTKIQSGSIYYALAKLEQEGMIVLADELRKGAKVRKIYAVTEKGLEELSMLVKHELRSPIGETGSDKFILYPLLAYSHKEEIEREVLLHLEELEKKKTDIVKWQEVKVNGCTLEIEKISFEMMISNLDYQIRWHQALLSQMDRCMEVSAEVAELIREYDFSGSERVSYEEVADMGSLKNRTLRG